MYGFTVRCTFKCQLEIQGNYFQVLLPVWKFYLKFEFQKTVKNFQPKTNHFCLTLPNKIFKKTFLKLPYFSHLQYTMSAFQWVHNTQ